MEEKLGHELSPEVRNAMVEEMQNPTGFIDTIRHQGGSQSSYEDAQKEIRAMEETLGHELSPVLRDQMLQEILKGSEGSNAEYIGTDSYQKDLYGRSPQPGYEPPARGSRTEHTSNGLGNMPEV
jgi:hypothetical protein